MTILNPSLVSPGSDWPHVELYQNVKEALYSLPYYFRTETHIEGISATDIFTLNSALGATIENQVVTTLNQMRSVWDPDEKYILYAFVRQSQTFPDVLLRKVSEIGDSDRNIILGIELKGWYLIAKEGEPSFRFQVTPAACNMQDLLVVVPWALDNVISGSPKVFTPYIQSARYAAEYRNYHWSELRETKGDRSVISPQHVTPYPRKSEHILDRPVSDSGGNFGRFARTGMMDVYLEQAKNTLLAGINAQHWLSFFRIFQDQKDKDAINLELSRLRKRVEGEMVGMQTRSDKIETVFHILNSLENLIDSL